MASSRYSCTATSDPSGSQQLSRNMESMLNSPSSIDTSMRRALRMATGGGSSSGCQLQGSPGSASGPTGATFWGRPDKVPSSASELAPARNPEQMLTVMRGRALAIVSSKPGNWPARRSTRYRRSAWSRPGRLAAGAGGCPLPPRRAAPVRWPCAGCPRPSRPPGGRVQEGRQAGDALDGATPVGDSLQVGAVQHGRRTLDGGQQIATPTGEVQVRPEAIGPGHEHGGGASDRAGAALGWRPVGRRGRRSCQSGPQLGHRLERGCPSGIEDAVEPVEAVKHSVERRR